MRAGVTILNRAVREGFIKMILQERAEGGDGVRPMAIWGKNHLDSWNVQRHWGRAMLGMFQERKGAWLQKYEQGEEPLMRWERYLEVGWWEPCEPYRASPFMQNEMGEPLEGFQQRNDMIWLSVKRILLAAVWRQTQEGRVEAGSPVRRHLQETKWEVVVAPTRAATKEGMTVWVVEINGGKLEFADGLWGMR